MLHLQHAALAQNNVKPLESVALLTFREFQENIFLTRPGRPAISEKMLQDLMSQRQAPRPNFNFQLGPAKSICTAPRAPATASVWMREAPGCLKEPQTVGRGGRVKTVGGDQALTPTHAFQVPFHSDRA